MSTAREAGWRLSRYNITAEVPGEGVMAIVNLYRGTCSACGPIEALILQSLDEVDERHPIVERLARLGILVNFDERAALESLGRIACGRSNRVDLTICPTMACNFDCPYCFERHRRGRMSDETQADVLSLAERLMKSSRAGALNVTWYGGEPLLAPEIIKALSKALIALAEREGAQYSARIITNGYLLTREMAGLLERAQVRDMQITLDGIGPAHDLTRHLADGSPTFDRIAANLRGVRLPFHVNIRHNIHGDNRGQAADVRAFVEALAAESGNRLEYYPALVSGNAASGEREAQVPLLCGVEAEAVTVGEGAASFTIRGGCFCGAQTLYSMGVDEGGRLYRCWEDVDKPERSFGAAAAWDPADPIASADRPDMLTAYLNNAVPIPDQECMDCIWLPMCSGGCARRRFDGAKACLPWKDSPRQYALMLYARLTAGKGGSGT